MESPNGINNSRKRWMDRDLNYFDRGPYGHPLASLAKTPYDAIKREPKNSYQSLEVNSSYDYLVIL